MMNCSYWLKIADELVDKFIMDDFDLYIRRHAADLMKFAGFESAGRSGDGPCRRASPE